MLYLEIQDLYHVWKFGTQSIQMIEKLNFVDHLAAKEIVDL